MLTEDEANRRYTREKQIITGLSFLLSSGAAAMIAAKLPGFIPIISASVSALLTAYSIAVGLDRKAALMAKLQYQWSRIASDLERLWNRWYQVDAEAQLEEILKLTREASRAGNTEAPYDQALMEKWQKRVNLLSGIENAA